MHQEPAPAPEAPVRRRRRGRTALIVAAAAVIGIVGGTAVGYGIQAEREPTPLPALSQPGLSYPAKPLPDSARPAPLSAAEDRKVKTDGDLRKLLLAKPADAKDVDFSYGDGWIPLAEYADYYESPTGALEDQLGNRIRRVAATSWKTGAYRTTEIRLVQYRPSVVRGAYEHAMGQMGYMADEDFAGSEGDPIKGSTNGRYYLFPVEREPGYLDLYEARAYFQRGDVMVEIFMYDTKRISKKEISSVAERQLGRL
ncbi:hypothetical protein [Streptomyces formicae]|uniref:Uncharacterized protein n=1 Tax=Streptomyces formicae TaxID=1616117 RepID=A0ABY3WXE0_9ACTN|nr:hypothetical protein [Streptomyces formicae]UNM15967.1 hypothetical protein J4032_34855 [Streptomyces formicae]